MTRILPCVLLASCTIPVPDVPAQTRTEQFHPLTEALLPDRLGASYKMNERGEYTGTNIGFVWGLDWEDWLLDD